MKNDGNWGQLFGSFYSGPVNVFLSDQNYSKSRLNIWFVEPIFFVLFNYKYFVLKLDVHVLINWQYLANEFRLCSNYPIGTITDDKSMSYHKWHALFYQAVAGNEPVNSVLPRSLSSSDEMAIGTMISFISHLKWSILCLIGRFEGRKLPIYEIVWAITDENTPIKLKIIELIDGHKHFSTQ